MARYCYSKADGGGFTLWRGTEAIATVDHLHDLFTILKDHGVSTERDLEYRRPSEPSAYDLTFPNLDRVLETLAAAGWQRGFYFLDIRPGKLYVALIRGKKRIVLTTENWEKAVNLANHEERLMENARELHEETKAEASHEADRAMGRLPTTDAF